MSWPSYPTYKSSGVSWLGHLPAEWTTAPCWTLFRRTKKLGHPELELLSVYRDHGVLPKASRSDNFNKPSEDLSQYQRVDPGSLVVNKMKAWQGSVSVSEYAGIVSPAYFVYEALSKDNDLRFLHYILRSTLLVAQYASHSYGVRPNQWDLDPQAFSRLPIPLPPTSDQVRIAKFLDRETVKIDALIDKQEQLIATLREDRAATITQAVTRGLDPNTKMRASGVQWIGEIPETWNVLRLSWMFGTISGGTTPDSKNLNYYGGEINWVTTGELREGYIEETTSKVTDLALTEHSALRVYEPGSLIIAMYGATIGRLGILSAPACTNQACCVFATPTQTDARFVFYVLQAAREHLLVLASGGGQPNINQDKLRALRVPAPNLVTQRIIAEHLDERCSKIDSLIDKSAEMIEVLREYRSALITNAVTGKIDVREAV